MLMTWVESAKLIADIAIALFTAALVRATYVLAKHTKVMSDRDAERARTEDLLRCVRLAEDIIKIVSEDHDRWTEGDQPSFPLQPFNELLALSKYLSDSDTKRLLESVTSVVTSDLLSNSNSVYANDRFKKELKSLASRLSQEIIELQRALGNHLRC
jgi:hypothetical protein